MLLIGMGFVVLILDNSNFLGETANKPVTCPQGFSQIPCPIGGDLTSKYFRNKIYLRSISFRGIRKWQITDRRMYHMDGIFYKFY